MILVLLCTCVFEEILSVGVRVCGAEEGLGCEWRREAGVGEGEGGRGGRGGEGGGGGRGRGGGGGGGWGMIRGGARSTLGGDTTLAEGA